MSLTVQHLTKVFGTQTALNDISFSVDKGEIVGFLGPNGAGKSTTMKIATGYLPATSGKIKVNEYDVAGHPLEVKRITGYLPEHNPLYLDLFVHEYLCFIGKLYGINGKVLQKRVAEMVELCGLTHEQNKKIEALSKGYRQRIGLAQALIHDPQVLILDEPTTGLDPNQILEIRKLILDISKNKTVIFSTHIMQEVQALCDRVIVIHRGEIVADDRLENLMYRSNDETVVVVEFENGVSAEDLQSLSGVREVVAIEGCKFKVIPVKGKDLRPELFRFAADKNLSLIGLKQEESSLENIFRELTI
jgi:gliding motility-associated transport system ATP-binding protein